MPEIKAVIFDLDGTLLDTIGDIADSMNDVLLRSGYPAHDRREYLSFVGDGMDVLVRRALPEDSRTDAVASELVAGMREEYARRWRDTSRPFSGIPELLDALTDRGLSMAVLSNKLESFTRDMVEALLGSWRFSPVKGLNIGSPRKPDPAAALEIARNLGVEPGQIMFVGDSGIDMETAVRSGMLPVGVLWGYQSAGQLLDKGAAILLEHPLDLLLQL